jgi:hypothetical protein
MNLYIEEENGAAKNHPALEENLVQVWGCVPDHWKPFVNTERPVLKLYEICDENVYGIVNDVYTDVWNVRDMTAEEKLAKQNEVKAQWQQRLNLQNFATWVFDEDLCRYVAPVPRPEGDFKWSGIKNNWVALPPYPTDGKLYTFDITTEAWIPNE